MISRFTEPCPLCGHRLIAPALTPAEVVTLRRRHAAGWKPRALATYYGIDPRSVYRYLKARPTAP